MAVTTKATIKAVIDIFVRGFFMSYGRNQTNIRNDIIKVKMNINMIFIAATFKYKHIFLDILLKIEKIFYK